MNVTPLQYNFSVDKGRDLLQEFTFKDEDGNALDLSGYTFRSQARESSDPDSTLIIEHTVDYSDANVGTVRLTNTDTETGAIADDVGYYDLLVSDGSGLEETWVYGMETYNKRPTVKA